MDGPSALTGRRRRLVRKGRRKTDTPLLLPQHRADLRSPLSAFNFCPHAYQTGITRSGAAIYFFSLPFFPSSPPQSLRYSRDVCLLKRVWDLLVALLNTRVMMELPLVAKQPRSPFPRSLESLHHSLDLDPQWRRSIGLCVCFWHSGRQWSRFGPFGT